MRAREYSQPVSNVCRNDKPCPSPPIRSLIPRFLCPCSPHFYATQRRCKVLAGKKSDPIFVRRSIDGGRFPSSGGKSMVTDDVKQPADQPPALRSVHTASFPRVLEEVGSSVLVTTYQAGKLIVLRHDGGVLNTHFRDFVRPMGLAYAGAKLAVGTSVEVQEFHNVPAVCAQLDLQHPHPGPLPEGEGGGRKHDACFLPRRSSHHRRRADS